LISGAETADFFTGKNTFYGRHSNILSICWVVNGGWDELFVLDDNVIRVKSFDFFGFP
jgi:hypothetical protein